MRMSDTGMIRAPNATGDMIYIAAATPSQLHRVPAKRNAACGFKGGYGKGFECGKSKYVCLVGNFRLDAPCSPMALRLCQARP